MNYSNASAQRRIDAARLTKDVPEVLGHLDSGEINLSQISVIAQAIRQLGKTSQEVILEIRENLVNEIVGKNLNQTEVIVSNALNIPVKEACKTKHQRDESVQFEVTLSKEQWEKFNQARDVLSNSIPNGSDWSKVIEYMSERVISKRNKTVSLKARAPKFSTSGPKKTEFSTCQEEINTGRTAIPKPIQREVFARDKCCQFQSKLTGHKCASTWNLTLDHIRPVWAGGTNSVDNLRVFCAGHNGEVYRQQASIRCV